MADKDLASIVGDIAMMKSTVDNDYEQRAVSELLKDQADRVVKAVV